MIIQFINTNLINFDVQRDEKELTVYLQYLNGNTSITKEVDSAHLYQYWSVTSVGVLSWVTFFKKDEAFKDKCSTGC